MDILKMLAELRTEREQIEEAITVLERLAGGQGKRRGRPPKWMSSAADQPKSDAPRRKHVISPEARARMAAAQRKRWATKRAEAKGA